MRNEQKTFGEVKLRSAQNTYNVRNFTKHFKIS